MKNNRKEEIIEIKYPYIILFQFHIHLIKFVCGMIHFIFCEPSDSAAKFYRIFETIKEMLFAKQFLLTLQTNMVRIFEAYLNQSLST